MQVSHLSKFIRNGAQQRWHNDNTHNSRKTSALTPWLEYVWHVRERASARTHTVLTRCAVGLPEINQLAQEFSYQRILLHCHSFIHCLSHLCRTCFECTNASERASERKCCLFLLPLVRIALHCTEHLIYSHITKTRNMEMWIITSYTDSLNHWTSS